MTTSTTRPQFDQAHKAWFVTGFSGRKYWGATARDAEQNAALYFYA